MKNKIIQRVGVLFLAILITACNTAEETPTADSTLNKIDETAVADSNIANDEGTIAETPTERPTQTPIVETSTPVPTVPPPPTNTPVPTVTPADTETPIPPTDTPEPTPTEVPPTATSVPVQPQPTAPPAQPTVPPEPVFGGNLLVNGSFEEGWYNLNGIPELQLPNGWGYEWDVGPTGFGTESWDNWVRPETRVLPDSQLPSHERPLFIRDGIFTLKMFKGNGAISYRLVQDIPLQPGTYVFQINVFPDLVAGYDNGNKVYAGAPDSGEVRFITPDGGTGWILPAFGRWNTFEHIFTINDAQTVRVGAGIRGRYALTNNGWFIDQWSLRRIEN